MDTAAGSDTAPAHTADPQSSGKRRAPAPAAPQARRLEPAGRTMRARRSPADARDAGPDTTSPPVMRFRAADSEARSLTPRHPPHAPERRGPHDRTASSSGD